MPAKATKKATTTPAKPSSKKPAAGSPKADATPPTAMTLLAAAELVLNESEFPLTIPRIMEEIATRGLWSSPSGKTPQATLHAGINREIAKKREASRFVKVDSGFYGWSGREYR